MDLEWRKFLGSGASGYVWLARDTRLDRDVAVKFFHNDDIVDFELIQAHTASLIKIKHPNVVSIFSAPKLTPPAEDESPEDEIHESLAIVMEYVDGVEYADWYNKPSISKSELLLVLEGILDGLEAFHDRGLVHGDLHSKNVRVHGDVAKIIDPIYRNPGIVFSTTENTEAVEKDLRDVVSLIGYALSRFSGALTIQGVLPLIPPGELTILRIKKELKSALLDAQETSPATTNSTKTQCSYDQLRKCQESNNVVGWQERKKIAIRSMSSSLDSWLEKYRGFNEREIDKWTEPFSEGIQSLSDLINLVLTSSESPSLPTSHDVFTLFKPLYHQWPQSGYSTLTEFPASCVFVLHNLAGATLCLNNGTELAASLVSHKLRNDSTGHDEPLFQISRLTSDPHALGGDWLKAWNYLESTFESINSVNKVFQQLSDFKASLGAYNLLLTLHDYFETRTRFSDAHLAEKMESMHFLTAPVFVFLSDSESAQAREILTGRTNIIQHLESKYSMKYNNDMWDSWVNSMAKQSRDSRQMRISAFYTNRFNDLDR